MRIHGNGRTSRITSYVVLTVKSGFILGSPTTADCPKAKAASAMTGARRFTAKTAAGARQTASGRLGRSVEGDRCVETQTT
jgi:hypothetical protein